MEPIRPDDDELRATRGSNTAAQQEKNSERTGNPPKKGKGDGKGGGSGGGKSPSRPFFLILLLAVVVAGAVGWYQQSQRIEQIESQLEEADYWVRQSKLALARFQGELSETGEDLQEKGQSLEQRFSAQNKRLDEADSEIRKLWGVANDRNKARLNDHEARLDSVNKTLQAAAEQRDALTTSLSGLEKTLTSQMDTLESSLQGQVSKQSERLDSQQAALQEIQGSLAVVKASVDERLTRFQREQALAINGLESRISSLEVATQRLSGERVDSIRSDLANLKQTVASIDASRAQITSRLVRLSEEVSQLRSRVVGQ